MDASGRLAVLLSDGFGGFGGIAKFNRDLLSALDTSRAVERALVFPRIIYEPVLAGVPESVLYDRRSARGKWAFGSRVIAHLLTADPIDFVVCGHINLLPLAWLLARAKRARLALIIHGIEAWRPPKSILARRLASRVDSFVSVSCASAEQFVAWSGVSMERCTILPNTVDTQRFTVGPPDRELVRRYGLEGCKVALTVGRLDSRERYKGFDEVIDALPSLLRVFPTLKYLIVGDGPDQARLKEKCRKLGLGSAVVFSGRISEEEKVAHYNLADVYVMPSRGEGFGIVLIEAAACGLPIVGSRIDGSREALLGGKLGRLVDPRDPEEIRDAMLAALRDGKPEARAAAVDMFATPRFRQRVHTWIDGEIRAATAAS